MFVIGKEVMDSEYGDVIGYEILGYTTNRAAADVVAERLTRKAAWEHFTSQTIFDQTRRRISDKVWFEMTASEKKEAIAETHKHFEHHKITEEQFRQFIAEGWAKVIVVETQELA
jgi:hypothetical protein